MALDTGGGGPGAASLAGPGSGPGGSVPGSLIGGGGGLMISSGVLGPSMAAEGEPPTAMDQGGGDAMSITPLRSQEAFQQQIMHVSLCFLFTCLIICQSRILIFCS